MPSSLIYQKQAPLQGLYLPERGSALSAVRAFKEKGYFPVEELRIPIYKLGD